MYWEVEWKTWNEEIKDYETSSDVYHPWEKTLEIFMECVKDNLCGGATVYCFMGDMPYTTDDPIVLEYRP